MAWIAEEDYNIICKQIWLVSIVTNMYILYGRMVMYDLDKEFQWKGKDERGKGIILACVSS